MRQGAVILTSIVLAKSSLSLGEIGVWEMLLYIGTVLTFFWVHGLLQAMAPVHGKLSEADRKAFVFNVFLVFCALSLCLFAVLAAGQRWVVPLLTGQAVVPHFLLFASYLLFHLPAFPVEYFYLLEKKPRHIVGWGMFSFGAHVLAVFVPLWLGYGLREGLLCLLALSVLRWLWTAFMAWQTGCRQLRPDLIRPYLRFSAPLMLNVLVGNFVLLFDNWLVGWWYKDEAVFAVFRYGAREFPLVLAMATALGVAIVPRLTEDFSAGLADLKAMTRKLFHLLFPLSIVLIVCTKPLFPLVFNPELGAGAPIFIIYLMMVASRVLLPNSIVLALGEPRVIFTVGLAELMVKIVLGFALVYCCGLPGIAWSAVLAFWVEKIGLIWYLERRHGVRTTDWLDIKWYLTYVFLLLAAWLFTL